jgi:hypothetical protein
VSRLFTRFEDQGVLQVQKKHIRIRDFDALKELACCVGGEISRLWVLPNSR